MDDQQKAIETQKSLTGKELPSNWPLIATPEEEVNGYDALYDSGEDRTKPPIHAHIERLSYELTSGDKRMRFFAVFHQRDISGSNDPNLSQYESLEKKFLESPPQLVLYEGYIDDSNHPLTRDQAISLGEPVWMLYLVQQHNANLPQKERIMIESGDASVNTEPNDRRDPGIIKNAAEKFEEFDRIDIVFGSGHAIREKPAWEQYFDTEAKPLQLSQVKNPIKEETPTNNP